MASFAISWGRSSTIIDLFNRKGFHEKLSGQSHVDLDPLERYITRSSPRSSAILSFRSRSWRHRESFAVSSKMLFALFTLAALTRYLLPVAAYEYSTTSLCTTKLGTKTTSPVKTTSYAVTVPVTVTVKSTFTPVSTITPPPQTTSITVTATVWLFLPNNLHEG